MNNNIPWPFFWNEISASFLWPPVRLRFNFKIWAYGIIVHTGDFSEGCLKLSSALGRTRGGCPQWSHRYLLSNASLLICISITMHNPLPPPHNKNLVSEPGLILPISKHPCSPLTAYNKRSWNPYRLRRRQK